MVLQDAIYTYFAIFSCNIGSTSYLIVLFSNNFLRHYYLFYLIFFFRINMWVSNLNYLCFLYTLYNMYSQHLTHVLMFCNRNVAKEYLQWITTRYSYNVPQHGVSNPGYIPSTRIYVVCDIQAT